ncbi:MAG: hypothetical protein Ta2G_09640 [Termitinemataceae bacterium]|nr:MAG: hypothetical protein Ta2G_09640 [Termitinemataceae bacterium]
MDNATINWFQGMIKLSDIKESRDKNLDKHGFYVILTGKFDPPSGQYTDIKLQYIGQAYKQTIRVRILQEHDAYTEIAKYLKKNIGFELLVMSGTIATSSLAKLTYQFIDDVEACLIFDNQPLCNTRNMDSYNGRNITVNNTGDYLPLQQVSIC